MTKLLYSQGVIPYNSPLTGAATDYYPVMMDGQMVGWVHHSTADSVEQQIRCMKVNGLENVSNTLICSCRIQQNFLLKRLNYRSEYSILRREIRFKNHGFESGRTTL